MRAKKTKELEVMSNELSNCCGAPVRIGGEFNEGTCYYVCTKCGKPCDVRTGRNEVDALAEIICMKYTPVWQDIMQQKAKQIAEVAIEAGYRKVEPAQLKVLTDEEIKGEVLPQAMCVYDRGFLKCYSLYDGVESGKSISQATIDNIVKKNGGQLYRRVE